jgi:hypothetical protein
MAPGGIIERALGLHAAIELRNAETRLSLDLFVRIHDV